MPPTPRMFMRISDKDRKLIAGLRHKWGLGDDSETVRAAIRRAAEQEGISASQLAGPRLMDSWTERARKVMVQAQEEALQLNHDFIGTEHLLLALTSQGDGVAYEVLTNLGVEHAQVREAIERIVGRGEPGSKSTGEMSLTRRAKRVMEQAMDEAKRFNNNYIGTQHLLLGLLREGEGVAAGVLQETGVTYEKAQHEVVQVLNRERSGSQNAPPWREIAQTWNRQLQYMEAQGVQVQTQSAIPPRDIFSTLHALADPNLQVALAKFVRLLDSPKFRTMLDEIDAEDGGQQGTGDS